MASVAYTNITAIQYNNSMLDISGFKVENYRIAAGQAPGDTAVLPTTTASSQAPTRGRGVIKAVIGAVGNNIGSASSNVTVTLPAMGATDATIPAVDVWIVWAQQ